MIVIRMTPYNQDMTRKALEEIKKIPGCCDEVWFGIYSYAPVEEHAKMAEIVGELFEALRSLGIRPAMELGTNLGHGDTTEDTAPVRSFEKMVGIDGYTAQGAFCPAGKTFLDYQCEVIKLYAAKQPYAIYLDDDLRLEAHGRVGISCFCEHCIEEFNLENGTSYTRSEIESLIESDIHVREAYVAMNRRHMRTYAKRLSEAAMSVCPAVHMGWENVYLSSYNGDDFSFVFEGLREGTGKAPFSRPGCFYYNDNNPRLVLDKVINTSYQNAITPEYVTVRRPEIENTSHTVMGKTTAGTCVEATLNLAYGCNGLSFSMHQTGTEPISFRTRMWKAFSIHRPYWQGLIDDLKETGVAGVRPVYYKDLWKAILPDRKFAWTDAPRSQGRELIQIGLPISYEDDFCSVYYLHPTMIDYLSDENIRDLLTRNVITDGEAVIKLAARGYGSDIPVSAESNGLTYNEIYTDHPANGHCCGKQGMVDAFTHSAYFHRFTPEKGCSILAHDAEGHVTCALGKVSGGGTWAFVGSSLWCPMINGVKRNHLIYLADYLSGGLPAYLDTPSQTAVIPRATRDGRFKAITLQNISIDETEPLEVVVKDPVSEQFMLSRPGYADYPVTYCREGERFRIFLPPIAPWASATLRAL